MDFKTLIVPGLLLVACAFLIAAAATPWLTIGDLYYTAFLNCDSNTCVAFTTNCAEFGGVRNANGAFTIIACIVLVIGLITSLVRLCVESCAAGGSCAARTVFVTAAIGVVCAFFSWVFAFALFDAEFCNSKIKDIANAKVGPQGPLALIGFLVSIGVCVCEFLFAGNPFGAPAASSSAPAAASGESAPAKNAPEQQQ